MEDLSTDDIAYVLCFQVVCLLVFELELFVVMF